MSTPATPAPAAAKHTPTPWQVAAYGCGPDHFAIVRGVHKIAVSIAWENDAQFIATAVNEHDALVADNARLRAALKEIKLETCYASAKAAKQAFSIARAALIGKEQS